MTKWKDLSKTKPSAGDKYVEFLVLRANPRYINKSGYAEHYQPPRLLPDILIWNGSSFMTTDSNRKPIYWLPIPEAPKGE